MINDIEKKFQYTEKSNYKSDIEKNVLILNENHAFDGKTVIIFGVNIYTEHIIMSLEKYSVKVEAIVDNDKNKLGLKCRDISVDLPSNVLIYDKNKFVILIASRYFDSMSKELMQMGYNRKKQIYRLLRYKHNIFEKNDMNMFIKSYRWYKTYMQFREKYDKDTSLFLMPVTGLGDVYFSFGYLVSYIKINHIKKYHILSVGKTAIDVGVLFGLKNVSVVSSKEISQLISFGNLIGYEKTRILCMHWAFKKGELITSIHRNMSEYSIPFNMMYQYSIFGNKLDFIAPSYIPDIELIQARFKEMNLQIGKTVIIAPASNTLVGISKTVWEEIINVFKENGFSVCTNIAGDKDEVLPGTVGLACDIRDSIAMCETAGYFVSVRSGLCDIVCTAACKKVIIYTESARLNNAKEVFSFSSMGVGNDILEISYEEGNEIAKRIYSYIKCGA